MVEKILNLETNVSAQLLTSDTKEDLLTLVRTGAGQGAADSAAAASDSADAAALSASDASDSADAAAASAAILTNRGRATMSAGTATVVLPTITANANVLVSSNAALVVGALQVVITAGVGFAINSDQNTDAGAVAWMVVDL